MKKFEFLDHTADVMFKAYGNDLEELFENSGLALEEAQVSVSEVEEDIEVSFDIENNDLEMLLFNFLQELIYYRDVENLVFSSFKVEFSDDNSFLKCTCKGEKLDSDKHDLGQNVKAITLHNFSVNKEDGLWKANVLVDV